jgi:hypothetical protein
MLIQYVPSTTPFEFLGSIDVNLCRPIKKVFLPGVPGGGFTDTDCAPIPAASKKTYKISRANV